MFRALALRRRFRLDCGDDVSSVRPSSSLCDLITSGQIEGLWVVFAYIRDEGAMPLVEKCHFPSDKATQFFKKLTFLPQKETLLENETIELQLRSSPQRIHTA